MGLEDSEKTPQIIREMTNPIEAIVNLLYLIRHDASDVKQVLRYVSIAESQCRCLVEVIQREQNF